MRVCLDVDRKKANFPYVNARSILMKRAHALLTGSAAIALAASAVGINPAMAEPIPAVSTYADLLEPVPDAMERLSADDARQATARLIPTQYYQDPGYPHHHHHHHHHQYDQYDQNGGDIYYQPQYRQRIRHSRHWYRYNGYNWDGGQWIVRPTHHHHHHHHHHSQYDGY